MNLYFNGPKSAFLLVPALVGADLLPDLSYGSDVETTVRVNSVQFGDGYEQRSLDGINTAPLKITANFNKRTLLVITEIDKFLRGDTIVYRRTPEEYFYYTPPPPYSDAGNPIPRKFKCLSWRVTVSEHGNYNLTAAWDEVFDP